MNEVFQDYCKTSSVHGVKYFTEPKRHWIERYFREAFLFTEKIKTKKIKFVIGYGGLLQ